jgi:uncharacterized protein with NRDE domain
MCTILFFYKVFDEYPIIIASNRDEFYSRRSVPPIILNREPLIFGGQDLKAGGTWMGVNQHRLWTGIANGKSPRSVDLDRRSRGLLCLDLLKNPSSEDAVSQISKNVENQYNPFYLIIADKVSGYAVEYKEQIEVHPVTPGLHIMTNQGIDVNQDPRRRRILETCQDTLNQELLPSPEEFKKILGDHGEHEGTPVCIHSETGGTRSSTLLYLRDRIRDSKYYFSEASPCQSDYRDYSALFNQNPLLSR